MKITLDFDEKIISLNHDVKIQELIEHLKKMNIEWEEWSIAWLPSYQWNTSNPWTTNPDFVTFSSTGTKVNDQTPNYTFSSEELDEIMKKLDVK